MAAGVKPGYQIARDETGLTRRERQVLGLMMQGRNGPEIAADLGVTKQRVEQIAKALVVKGRLEKTEHAYRVVA